MFVSLCKFACVPMCLYYDCYGVCVCMLKESTAQEYKERYVQKGYNSQAASGAEVQYYKGQDFGTLGKDRTFRMNQPLLLGFGRRNDGLSRARKDPKTRNLPTVVGAVEKGIQKARVWKPHTPQDVCEAVAEQGNESHGGAGNAWPQLLRMTHTKVDDGWFAFKDKLKKKHDGQDSRGSAVGSDSQGQGDDKGDSAAKRSSHEEYELMWKFVRVRWGHHYSGKQQLIDVRSINRRLTKEFGAWDLVLEDASCYGDWTGPSMNTAKVVRALLVVTQCFEKWFLHSLPQEDFLIHLRTWCRLCYPNQPLPENEIDSRYGLWCCDSSEDAALLLKVLGCKMTGSAVYKHATIKDAVVKK